MKLRESINRYMEYAKDKEILKDSVQFLNKKIIEKGEILDNIEIEEFEYSTVEDYYEKLFDNIVDKLA